MTIIKLFQDMSDLTSPECGKNCKIPHSCCSSEYCDMAREYAQDLGITLKPTEYSTLPFMGQSGCIVEPYLRPLCTLHTCAINGLGFKAGDRDWTNKYFELREKIESELSKNDSGLSR